MAGELHGIGNDATVSKNTIMRNMHIGHNEAVAAYFCFKSIGSTPAYGYKFPNYGVISNDHRGLLTRKFQILRERRNYSSRKNLYTVTQTGTIHYNGIWANPTVVPDFYIGCNGSKRFNPNIGSNTGIGMNIG
jgi:hypothetical protein